jgi:hypothetical protein
VSSLHSCGPLAYSDNERAKQLLYGLDDSIWGMKITALEESADFTNVDTEKLFTKLKSHELSRKGRPNHDASITSKAFVTSTRVGGHVSNPTNTTDSSVLEFALSSLSTASDEQYESIPNDEIALLMRKFHKERRRSPRGCFECGDTTHFIADCPKRKKLDSSSNKYGYTKRKDYNKGMSAKPCKKCTMIIVSYADLCLMHSHVARLLDGASLELRELKARSILLGACTSCPVLKSDLEAAAVEIKNLKHKLDHSSSYTVLSPRCEACVSLKCKLFYAIKENTKLQQEVAYLTACLEKTALSEKMTEEDLSRVEQSASKSTYRLSVGFERCEKKGEKSAPKFIPSSTYHKEEATIRPTKAHYPSNAKPSFNPKREVRKEIPKSREEAFICIFCGHAGHLDEFCFRRKRTERRHVEYARNSYRDEFLDLPPRSYSSIPPRSYSHASSRTFSRTLSCTSSFALPQFAHGPNHRSYGFGP